MPYCVVYDSCKALLLIRLVISLHAFIIISQIYPESVELLQHEVHVLLGAGLVGDDGPEEIGLVVQRLVADHQVARVHHPGLELGGHAAQLLLPLLGVLHPPQPLWHIPEAEVDKLGLVINDVKSVTEFLHSPQLILGQVHDSRIISALWLASKTVFHHLSIWFSNPCVPLALQASQNLKMSLCLPHWITLSPVS